MSAGYWEKTLERENWYTCLASVFRTQSRSINILNLMKSLSHVDPVEFRKKAPKTQKAKKRDLI